MKILVTGANGFIGRNLVAELKNRGYYDIYPCDCDTTAEQLVLYLKDCEFVFHLAGINRPETEDEFMEGNAGFTESLLKGLKAEKNKSPVLMTSSIQAELENSYGRSKAAAEAIMKHYEEEEKIPIYIYRLPNVFGKWCLPNYNSVIATFCHNTARGLEIKINDTSTVLNLVYIDDVVNELIHCMEGRSNKNRDGFYHVAEEYKAALGEIADLIKSFKESRENLFIPNMGDSFVKKLYSTYLSYLPEDSFSYSLKMNTDERGAFTEFFRTGERGQVSVNISKPGITKGNHWHHTKNEKFLVVHGEGIIQFRRVDKEEIIEYHVSGENLEVIDIPTGYAHNIINVGAGDMVTVMWANEVFDSGNPDTYYGEVMMNGK